MDRKATIVNIEGNADKIFRLNEIGIRIGKRIEITKSDIIKIDGTRYALRLNGIKIYYEYD
jgi:Fe2+ transport system protein FeoA